MLHPLTLVLKGLTLFVPHKFARHQRSGADSFTEQLPLWSPSKKLFGSNLDGDITIMSSL
jgi:hypothetical protein